MAQPAVRLIGTVRRTRAALLGASALQAAACLVLALPAAAQPAPSARPQGGQVVAGGAAIATTANATTITQSTNRAAVNWSSFDIGSQQSVVFAQPGPTAVTLNRVTGPDPSAIAGRISANGQVILTNPSGVTFHQGAQVNTQSIVVSAPGITNQNFMAGRMVFDQAASPNARIDNRGTITVKQAGLAALVAPSVANSGVINARLGQVVLAGAATHTLDMYGDGLVSIDVTGQVRQAPRGPDGKPVTALVTNTGAILADGGVVQLTAKAADGVVQTLVRAGGRIRANTDGAQIGRIEVTGTGGSVVVEGRLAADGRAPGAVGGQVAVMGDGATQVAASARISASGRAGGGTVAIGTTLARARGGASVTAPASTRTVIASGARIRADATGAGNGGQVSVLSTQDTQAGGAISARGGKQGGDGGTIELSGQQGFTLTGTANTGAPHGAPGTILIDPRDLTIAATGTNNIAPGGTAPNVGAGAGGTTTDAYVTPAQLQVLTGNVVLQATRDLTVASSVTYGNGALTLQAGNNLTVNTGVALAVPNGLLTLEAASAGIAGFNPAGMISLQGTVTAPNLTLNAGSGGISLGGDVSTGSLVINAPTGPVVQTGGGLTVTADISGSALSVSLPSRTNAVSGIGNQANALTVAGGDFTLVDHVDLAIGAVSTGGLSVPGGRTITLVTDSLTVNGTNTGSSLVAPNGAIAVSPFTAGLPIELVLTGTKSPAALVLTQADLNNISAINDAQQSGTLQLGVRDLATAAVPTSTITLGSNDQKLDLGAHGFFGTLSLLTSGAVSQGAGVAIGTLTGQAGSADLSNGNPVTVTTNTIGTLAGFTTTSGDFLLHTGSSLTVSGTVVANGGAGNVTLSSTLPIAGRADHVSTLLTSAISGATVSIDTTNGPISANTAGIGQTGVGIVTAGTLKLSGGFATLGNPNVVTNLGLTSLFGNLTLTNARALNVSDNVTLTNGTATFTAPSITQAATSTLTAATLSGGSGAAAFTSATNKVAAIGDFEAPNGSFALTTASPLLTIGKLNAPAGSAVIQADSVTLAAGNPSIAGSGGTVTAAFARFEPLTPNRPIELIGASAANPNALSLSQAFLNEVTTTTLAIGGPGATGAITIGNAGEAVTLTTHASTLQLETGGAVTSGAAATLAVAGLVGATGSLALTGAIGALGAGNAVPGTLTGYTTTAAALNLTSSIPLTVSNTVSAATALTLTGSTLTLAGPLSGTAITLNATAGDLLQTSGAIGTAGPLSLTASGAITQTGGSITAGSLTGSSGAATTLTGANMIPNLGIFTSNGGLTLNDGQSLTVNGPVTDATAITLGINGDLVIAGRLAGGALTLNLNPAGAISETGAGVLSGTTLTGSATSVALDQGASIAELDAFTTGAGFTLLNGQPLTVAGPVMDNTFINITAPITLLVTGNVSSPLVTLNAVDGGQNALAIGPRIVIPGDIIQTGGTIDATTMLTLTATGLIRQTGGAMVTPTLTGSSGTTTSITGGANAITTLAAFTSRGGFTLADSTGLAVTGPVMDPASITLGVNGALQLAGTLTTGALTTNATGAITQTSGSLQLGAAGTLTGGSSASATFNQPLNVLGALNAFAATGSFGLTDSTPLAINGAVSGSGIAIVDDRPSFGPGGSLSAPGGTVQLAALTQAGLTVGGGNGIGGAPPVNAATLEIGAPGGGPVTIAGGLNLSSVGTLDLESGVAIAEAGAGAIRVGALTGNGASATLGGANQIGTLGGFTTTGAFALTNAQTLAVTGPVNAGSASLNVTGDLAISGALTATQLLSLNVSGAVTEPGGVVTTGLLNGTAGSLSLPNPGNRIATLGPFSATGDFTLFDGESLTVVGPVDPGNVTINVLGDLVLASSVTGNIVSLTATGTISETGGGFVNAATLTGGAGAAAFTGNNFAATLGPFTSTNGFVLDNAVALTVAGPVTDASSIAITTRGPLTVAGAITAPATTLVATPGRGGNVVAPGDITQTAGTITASTLLTLTASGTINQTGGAITAATLTGSSGAAAMLPGANGVGTLGRFTSTGGFLLNSVPGLAVAGPVTDTAGITLGTGGNLTLSGVLTAPVVTTNVAGAITQPGGSVQAATLTGAAGTASFGQAGNGIATLGAFTLTGAPATFALTDGAPLTVGGAVTTGGGGFIGITANGLLFGPAGSLTAPSGTVQLAALPPSGLTVGGGNGITGSSPVTATTLILGAVTGGPVTVAGAFNLAGVSVLDLESAGAIAETGAGAIGVGTLTGHGASATLTGANQIGALGLFDVGGGALTLVNSGGLTITGPVNAGALTLATGPLVIAGSVAAGALTVTAGGGIAQTGGMTTIGVLTGSASGAVSLGYAGVADIGTLGPFSAGSLALLDRAPLTITGPLIAPQLGVSATGQLVLAGATIATGGLPVAQQRGGAPALPGSFLQVLPNAAGQAQLTQTGAVFVVPLSGSRATLRLDASGGISLASLTAPAANLVLSPGVGGTAAGNLDAGSLLVLGAGGSANLFGTVAGQTLFGAAYVSRIDPAFSQSYQINNCAIASISCVQQTSFILPQSFLRPDIISQDVIDLSPTRDRDDPTLLLPNISDRDY